MANTNSYKHTMTTFAVLGIYISLWIVTIVFLEIAHEEPKKAEQVEQESPSVSTTYVGEFSITHYCPCVKCTGNKDTTNVRTATGTIPKEGRTVAVDPKVIPLHSFIYVEDLGYFIAEDVGGAIKNKKLDIFVSNHNKALNLGTLGNQKKKVYILNYTKREG